MGKSHQSIVYRFATQRLLGAGLWLSFCFLWYPHAQAQATQIHSQSVAASSPSPIATAIELALLNHTPTPFAQLNNEKNRDSTAYWLNTLQASGGSAAGNATVIALFIALDILPALFNAPDSWVTSAGPLLSLLVLIPAVTTPLFMHLWSPHAKSEHWLGSGIASLISTLLHLGLMIGLGLSLNNMGLTNGLANSFYLLAPVGLISAVLIESMGTAAGYRVAKAWKSTTQRPQALAPMHATALNAPLVSTRFSF